MDDNVTIDEDETISVPVLANDTDPDNDPLTVSVPQQPENGSVEVIDNEVVFTPNPGFSGTQEIPYQTCDLEGFCDEATLTVNVISVNDPPVAVDDYASTEEDTPIQFSITDNDTDLDENEHQPH